MTTKRKLDIGSRVVVQDGGQYWPGTVININHRAIQVEWDDASIKPTAYGKSSKCIIGIIPFHCKKFGGEESIPKSKLRSWFPRTSKKSDSVNSKPKKTASQLRVEVINSKQDISEEIIETEQLLDTPRFKEKEHMRAYASMFKRLSQIIPIVEERCLHSEKTAPIYALMQLYNQLREVIADIRSITDFSTQSNKLVQNVLRPLTFDAGQNMIDIMFYIDRDIREYVSGDEYKRLKVKYDNYLQEHGRFLQQCYLRATEQVNAILEQK